MSDRAGSIAAAVAMTAAAAWLVGPLPAATAQAGVTVGVVEFYAPTPLPSIPGVVPEQVAAAELASRLGASAGARFVVVSAESMRRAEQAMQWRETDALNFDRLRALAQAAGATKLVIGWIPHLEVQPQGSVGADGGNGPPAADVRLVLQVFDAAQGRLVGEARTGAYALGGTPSEAVPVALRLALARRIPDLLTSLENPMP